MTAASPVPMSSLPAAFLDANVVVEWAPFRIADGVSEAELLSASDRLHEEVLRHHPGFVHRELVRLEGGQWADLVFWRNQETVQAIMAQAPRDPVFGAYFRCMKDGSMALAQRVRLY